MHLFIHFEAFQSTYTQFAVAKDCHHVEQILCDEFKHLTPNDHKSLLLFGACGKWSDHVNSAGGVRQLNS
jgi:hypothetical protein